MTTGRSDSTRPEEQSPTRPRASRGRAGAAGCLRGAVHLGAAVALVAGSCRDGADPPKTGAEAGRELFVRHCAACHGVDGRGGPLPSPGGEVVVARDLSDPQFQRSRSNSELMHVLSNGKNAHMPPFDRALSEPERRAVVSYLRRLDDESSS